MSVPIPQPRSPRTFTPKNSKHDLLLTMAMVVIWGAGALIGVFMLKSEFSRTNLDPWMTAVLVGGTVVAGLLAATFVAICFDIRKNDHTMWVVSDGILVITQSLEKSQTVLRLEHLVKVKIRRKKIVSVKFADGSEYSLSNVNKAEELYTLLDGYAR